MKKYEPKTVALWLSIMFNELLAHPDEPVVTKTYKDKEYHFLGEGAMPTPDYARRFAVIHDWIEERESSMLIFVVRVEDAGSEPVFVRYIARISENAMMYGLGRTIVIKELEAQDTAKSDATSSETAAVISTDLT